MTEETTTTIAKDIKKAIITEPKKKVKPEYPLLSIGSSLLNLAISDRVDGCMAPGNYYFIVGDSASGKTASSMTCFAEAMQHPFYKTYDIIHDNVEGRMMFDIPHLFGQKVADKVRGPKGKGTHSDTIEDFYYNLDDCIQHALKTKTSFIYVLDSMDGLTSEDEEVKFDENKAAHRRGKETKGSYGDGKAKKNSTTLRKMLKGLRKTKSILIIVSQTRDLLNAATWGPKKTRSGGRALKFYATWEIWSSPMGAVQKTVRGKVRKVGTKIKIQVVKNSVTGKLGEVETAIYPSHGIDDIGTSIDFLVAEKWWKKKGTRGNGTKIVAKEFGPTVELTRHEIVRISEKNPKKLRKALQRCWNQIQKDCALDRKPRYS